MALLAMSAAAGSQSTEQQAEPNIVIQCGPRRAVILKRVVPTYPADAVAKGIQGRVTISALVSKSGVPEKLRVLAGPPALVSSSLEAVKRWRYKPTRLNGKAVPIETSINIEYVLPRKKSASPIHQK